VQDNYHIGIHGTNQETLIGEAVSHGCVRMFEADIQTLYSHLKVGTPIKVMP
jgi:lipoprotein-anchoring transpeptidase ErfK/SrfK